RSLLEQNANVNEVDKDGRTALFRVARVGKLETLHLLLEFGANPNLTDEKDEAPLQAAARYGHLECVEALLAAGADVNHCPNPEKTDYSETALCSAARKGFAEV